MQTGGTVRIRHGVAKLNLGDYRVAPAECQQLFSHLYLRSSHFPALVFGRNLFEMINYQQIDRSLLLL
jgi:hypothetical protein